MAACVPLILASARLRRGHVRQVHVPECLMIKTASRNVSDGVIMDVIVICAP